MMCNRMTESSRDLESGQNLYEMGKKWYDCIRLKM